jgi:hypothetical protein
MGLSVREARSRNFEFGNHFSIFLDTEEDQENRSRDDQQQRLPDDTDQ